MNTYLRLAFTADVDAALQSDNPIKELRSLLDRVEGRRRQAITSLVDHTISTRQRQLIRKSLILHKEQRDLLTELLQHQDRANRWKKEFRFYQEPNGLVTCHCDNETFTVGDHFPSRCSLVVTEKTRDARAAFLAAMTKQELLWLHGPAGTGKTEIGKDTADLFGLNQLTMSCAEPITAATLLNSIFETGADVVILDSFHCLDTAAQRSTLSGLSDAGSRKRPLVIVVSAKPPSIDAMRTCRQSTLAVRSVCMTVPKMATIIDAMLAAEGFIDCDNLAHEIDICLQLCRDTCSGHSWYDFGLRTCRQIIRASGSRLHSEHPSQSDAQKIVCDTIACILFSRAAGTDKTKVMTAVKEAFGQSAILPLPWVQLNATECKYKLIAEMARDVSRVRHGTCVIGLDTAEADKCILSFRGILAHEGAPTMVRMVDDHAGLVQLLRVMNAEKSVEDTETVVFVKIPQTDDATDPLIPLHSLLDDNKKLNIGGQDVLLPPNTKLVFFAYSCDCWSRATTSRLGLVSSEVQQPAVPGAFAGDHTARSSSRNCSSMSNASDWKAMYFASKVECERLAAELQSVKEALSGICDIIKSPGGAKRE